MTNHDYKITIKEVEHYVMGMSISKIKYNAIFEAIEELGLSNYPVGDRVTYFMIRKEANKQLKGDQ